MENKEQYYKPSWNEITLEGYELEVDTWNGWKRGYFPKILEENKELDEYAPDDLMKLAHAIIRVPFLTKEQIETEGWKESEFVDKSGVWNSMEFLEKVSKDNFRSSFCFDCENYTYYVGFYKGYGYNGPPIKIVKRTTGGFFGGERIETIFHGRCHTMNEFRTLCKQLEIK